MSLLKWDKPSEGESDQLWWKAKAIGGKDPRVEIRKTTEGVLVQGKRGDYKVSPRAAQVLMVVRPDGTVMMSMNGKALIDIAELEQVILECRVQLSVMGV